MNFCRCPSPVIVLVVQQYRIGRFLFSLVAPWLIATMLWRFLFDALAVCPPKAYALRITILLYLVWLLCTTSYNYWWPCSRSRLFRHHHHGAVQHLAVIHRIIKSVQSSEHRFGTLTTITTTLRRGWERGAGPQGDTGTDPPVVVCSLSRRVWRLQR